MKSVTHKAVFDSLTPQSLRDRPLRRLLCGAKAPVVANIARSQCPLDYKQEEHSILYFYYIFNY